MAKSDLYPAEALNLIMTKFTIVVDTREQKPWTFQGFEADARDKYAEILVQTERGTLVTGDYSIKGLEDRVTIERKSLNDAFGTFGGDRDRWERELCRLQEVGCASVIVEAGWSSVLRADRPLSTKGRCFTPKMFYRSVISWQIKFSNVHWWFAPTARFAERTCFRILEKFWHER